ncbi:MULTISPECIES: acyl-CoA dehydrogenase family protein [Sorangium]|uniref:Acyl-CoA dehydrogenase n=1 Tax=Sorangium cellulosum TaxID=56 RepID=A0A4P2QK68_SORCE|nr:MULTISPECIES: acyl-CoA dehydrogenase family protein [Sorangium]AUX30384.1 acyl-CoA dehydrogenase [Sorangium cellulosum]WCQ89778.1 Caffeyl-CoA reductase-Etf complex subunit CarC [Sorangium sp. Soce836]
MTRLALSSADLPVFFEERHAALAARLTPEALAPLAGAQGPAAVARCMGEPLGLYAHLVPEALGGAPAGGGPAADPAAVDVRSLVLIREALGQVSPLADAIFAVQGLGSYPIVLAGSDAQRRAILPDVLSGRRIGAFALTEPEAGSDVASLRTEARREGDGWVLDGEKVLISNVPLAHHLVVFARTGEGGGRAGITAFLVDSGAPGVAAESLPMSVPHPIGRLRFDGCRVPDRARLGEVGGGYKLAMQTLDAFRISVGAAANGMAARALREAIAHVTRRRQFGAPLSEQQMVRAYLAEMATELDAARLLVARAAHKRDTGGAAARVSTEAAMAKMFATEAAQRIIDRAVQLHGGLGVIEGTEVERLYREIRPLRIYEGTTEIQKLIIAKGILDRAAAELAAGEPARGEAR